MTGSLLILERIY